jgi:tetratricopeptide (TPR) repeat protein
MLEEEDYIDEKPETSLDLNKEYTPEYTPFDWTGIIGGLLSTIPRAVFMFVFTAIAFAPMLYIAFFYDWNASESTEAIRPKPSNAEAYNSRNSAHKDNGGSGRAISDYNKATDVYINRGSAYYSKGDYDRAISDFTEAIRLSSNLGVEIWHPNYTLAYINRSIAYASKGNHSKAMHDLNEIIRLGRSEADAYMLRGNAYSEKGDYDRAISDFNEAMRRLNPNDANAGIPAKSNKGRSKRNQRITK